MSFFAHPQAIVETEDVGDGTRVWAFSHVMAGARVGRGCNIGEHCFVEKGAVIGNNVTVKNYVAIWDGITIDDGVFIGPHATLTNDLRPRSRQPDWTLRATHIGTGATIGANATIVCGVDIGPFAFIGAGSVVTANVAAHAMVYGNPARPQGYVCRCAATLDVVDGRSVCDSCGSTYVTEPGGVIRATS